MQEPIVAGFLMLGNWDMNCSFLLIKLFMFLTGLFSMKDFSCNILTSVILTESWRKRMLV